MLTKEEYKREYIRMMDFLKDKEGCSTAHKGEFNCKGVCCNICPFCNMCPLCIYEITDHDLQAIRAYDIIEVVEKWSKEHPVMTNSDKFKEVYGINIEIDCTRMPCPRMLGIIEKEVCNKKDCCEKCKEDFWNSEYKTNKDKE